MKLRVIATLVAVLAFGVGSASAQSIGIFADPGSASCNVNAALYVGTNFYINAVGSGALVPAGVNGAEFRVDTSFIGGADAILTPTPNPAATLALGNPFTGGCNIGFPGCQLGASVLLYTVQIVVLNAANTTNATMIVDQHTTPSNANFACALINKCDAPIYTAFCVPGGTAFLNGQGDCNVAVEDKTWSEVKNLFN